MTRARVVYYGHDLHFRRARQEAEVMGGTALSEQAERMEALERQVWRDCDTVLYPSQDEVDCVHALEPMVDARSVPAYAFDEFVDAAEPAGRAGIIFVAGFAHPPNVDAAEWLVRAVMPYVWAQVPDVRLALVGSNPDQRVHALAGGSVEVTGYVTDAELKRRYASARVAVVPLRFGAGVKNKVVEALQQGVPLVTTSVGAQGLPGLATACALTDEADVMAERIVELLRDDELWRARSRAGSAYVRSRFSPVAMSEALLFAFGFANVGEAV